MSQKYSHNRPAFNADAATRNRARRRERIGRQIDSIMRRSMSLPHDHPAQRGIERTIERLNIEYQAED